MGLTSRSQKNKRLPHLRKKNLPSAAKRREARKKRQSRKWRRGLVGKPQ